MIKTETPGIWYEVTRKRYRVRLYHKGKVVWLTYHPTLKEAMSALADAREYKKNYALKPKLKSDSKSSGEIVSTLSSLMNLDRKTYSPCT